MFDQEGGHDHPHPVVHPACRPQLTHAGVHQRIAGAAALPGLQPFGIVAPGHGLVFRAEGPVDDGREMVEQMGREVAPAQFRDELVRLARRNGAGVRRLSRPLGRAPGTDLAPVQVGGQAAGRGKGGMVAAFGVDFQAPVKEIGQGGVGAGLAGRPVEALGPVGAGRVQAAIVDQLGLDGFGGVDAAGGGRGRRRLGGRQKGLHEGGEDLVRGV